MKKSDFTAFLRTLNPEDWNVMATSKWTVKDVVAHLIGWERDDISIIRESWSTKQRPWFDTTKEYAEYNARWVERYKPFGAEQLIKELEDAQREVQKEIDVVGKENLLQYTELFNWLFDESDNNHYSHHYRQIKSAVDM